MGNSSDAIYKELDFIKFRMDLLFYNSDLDRMLYEYNVTREQNTALIELVESYSKDINEGRDVISTKFEQQIYDILPQINGDYHVPESFLRLLWEDGRWEEVFEKLYGESQKFKKIIEDKKN